MMLWVLFAVLSALIWAIVNVTDKYILIRLVKKPIVLTIILTIISVIIGGFIYFIRGSGHLSATNVLLAFVMGIIYVIGALLFFKAAQKEEISRIVPLFYLEPLFVLLFATFFLGEILSPLMYLGVFLIVFGAMLVSSRNLFKLDFKTAFWLMILSSFIFSINVMATKYLLSFADFWTVFSYTRIGMVFALVPLLYFFWKDFMFVVKRKNKKPMVLVTINELLNLVAFVLFTIALSTGYASLVSTLTALEPFFVLLFTIVLSIFLPKIVKEHMNKKIVAGKMVAIIMMFIGVILITT